MNEPDDAPKREYPFSEETIEALKEFGKVLLKIHLRLVKEGTIVEVDKHYKPKNQD